MQESNPTTRNFAKRRQNFVLLTGAVVILAYYLFRIAPSTLGVGFAFIAVTLIAGFGLFLAGFAKLSSRRARVLYTITPSLILAICFLLLAPSFQRASLQRKLEKMGARVTFTTNSGDGVWFRFGRIYLPCWMQEQLGEAFFGNIVEVDFSYRVVPVDAIVDLEFNETIDTLNLRLAEASNTDLARLTHVIDAREVQFFSTPIDADTLDTFGRMRSLAKVHVIKTDVSLNDANGFAARNPGITILHADDATGWTVVRAPVQITEP